MTKEELTNRAREFVCQLASGTPQEMEYFANILLEFANGVMQELKARNAELAGQKASLERWLGEASAIIKGLLYSGFGPTSKTVNYEVKSRAEQFLKEMSK